MDMIFIGKLFMVGLIFHVSPTLFKRVAWLQSRYELSFGTEDWLEWKYWFKIYRRFITDKILWYSIGWFVGFFGWYTIGYIIGVLQVRFFE